MDSPHILNIVLYVYALATLYTYSRLLLMDTDAKKTGSYVVTMLLTFVTSLIWPPMAAYYFIHVYPKEMKQLKTKEPKK